jgi:hypothetical protein
LQPIDPAIRTDVEHFFSNSQRQGGILQLKKDQWKALPKNLETLRQLPEASSGANAPPARS